MTTPASQPALRTDEFADVAATIRLLATVRGLPPSGSALLGLRQATGIVILDLAAVGPLGDGRLQALPVANFPGAGAAALAVALEERPQAGVAILSHSPYLAAWALARKPLPARYSPLLRLTEASEIALTAQGIADGPAPVRDLLRAHPGERAFLVADYGALVLGKDVETAARALASLEEAAHLAWAATAVGGSQPFPEDASERVARGIAGAGN